MYIFLRIPLDMTFISHVYTIETFIFMLAIANVGPDGQFYTQKFVDCPFPSSFSSFGTTVFFVALLNYNLFSISVISISLTS